MMQSVIKMSMTAGQSCSSGWFALTPTHGRANPLPAFSGQLEIVGTYSEITSALRATRNVKKIF